ncbi:putative glycosyltransferase [Gordonia terrae NBRC 100016]|nr:putative glycosyltransferase [Gordonia terrae NBRC 100016]VTR06762.1 D-inositol-3-phosphate glycosyltransferase [Clostridioides difficile]VTS35357.1 D-inositol-3-phosphate glycosyltransferase [Gordonia terrae]
MEDNYRVHLVAAPLMARSGVYNSLFDLIEEARSQGMPWTGTVAMRPGAPGTVRQHYAVTSAEVHRHGLAVVPEIRRLLASDESYARADWVVTLITQSDVAVFLDTLAGRRNRATWVSYIRGLPWPAKGEQKAPRRQLLRLLETVALRRARDVWVTTQTLGEDVRPWIAPSVVQPGIKSLPKSNSGRNVSGYLVWAGRLDVDKRPALFAEVCETVQRDGRIFGDGPLLGELRAATRVFSEVMGWATPEDMWPAASIYVGTSYREAFGRSAVEASLAGVPIVIGHRYGAARMLITDPDIAALCVVESTDPAVWSRAIRRLLDDPDLMARVSQHTYTNAQKLTIESSVLGIAERLTGLQESAGRQSAMHVQNSKD